MPKRKSRTQLLQPAALGILAGSALLLFGIGEAIRLTRADGGQLWLARVAHIGDHATVTRLVGKQLRRGLDVAGIPRDSLRESVIDHSPGVRWRIGVPHDASLVQLNYALTSTLEAAGAKVMSGREGWTDDGAMALTMVVGLGGRATHEVIALRRPRPLDDSAHPVARVALVLYGLGPEVAGADSFFTIAAPFAVALPPATPSSGALFKAAHARGREVVLHVPLEPINYPQVNPGPGTLLVTMKPAKVASELKRYIDQGAPVAAVANHMGSLATQDMATVSALYRELRRSGLPFLHVNPAAGAVCKSLASEMGIAYQEPGAVIDREARLDDSKALAKRWREILKSAHAEGDLIVLVRATPTTRRWLARAVASAERDHVSLAPLSALLRKPIPS